jgi:putative phosphoribosyl transferase
VRFRDRVDAGERLGVALEPFAADDPVVLGIPRGGVAVAAQVASHLRAPLDVIIVRKLGLPGQPELAMGAIGEDDVRVLNEAVLEGAGVDSASLDDVERRERVALANRVAQLRGTRNRVDLTGRVVIIVDDGIATGSSAVAAVLVARAQRSARVVVAVPVGPARTCTELRSVADAVVCLEQPPRFSAVGEHYEDFSQVTDDQVLRWLDREDT